jgi:hypothetical protein
MTLDTPQRTTRYRCPPGGLGAPGRALYPCLPWAHLRHCIWRRGAGSPVRRKRLIHDIALLDSMGIRLVLVHGARPQIDAEMRMRGLEPRFHNGLAGDRRRRAGMRQARHGRNAD